MSAHEGKTPNVKICTLMSVCTPESSSLDVQPGVVCGVGRPAELLTNDWLENRLKAHSDSLDTLLYVRFAIQFYE